MIPGLSPPLAASLLLEIVVALIPLLIVALAQLQRWLPQPIVLRHAAVPLLQGVAR
jgi:hypothetical protein